MTVYAEVVFLENFVINTALLSAVDRTLRAETAMRRKLLGALVGALFATISPFLFLPNAVQFPLKFILGALISKWGIKTRKKKRFFLSYLLFLGYTFLLGGVLIGMGNLTFGDQFSFLFSQTGFAPVFIAVAYLLFGAIRTALAAGRKINALSSFYYSVAFSAGGKQFHCRAYFDTGNRLQGGGDRPVLVCGKALFSRLITPKTAGSLQSFSVCTAAGETSLPMLPVEEIVIEQEKQKFRLAKAYVLAGKGDLFPVTGCEMLLGTETFACAETA